MAILVEDVGKFLGKTIQSPYSTPAGRLIGIDTNIRNEVTQVNIEQASGELTKYPIVQVRIHDDSIVLVPAWKNEAVDLEREYLTASRRMTALKALLSDGDIDMPSYKEMTSEYETALRAMERRRTELVDSLKERTGKLDERVRGLQLALTDNKLLYSSGVVEAAAYKEACQIIHDMLNGYAAEKKDIQETIESLAQLDQNQATQESIEPPHVEEKIPDFVVVKLNEETPA